MSCINKVLWSGILAIAVTTLCIVFPNVANDILESDTFPFPFIYTVLFYTTLGAGFANIDAGVGNYGAFALGVFIIAFIGFFCVLSLPTIIRSRGISRTALGTWASHVKAICLGSIICAILMFMSSSIGFLFVSDGDIYIVPMWKSLGVAIVIGLAYGIVAGPIVCAVHTLCVHAVKQSGECK